MSRIAKHRQRRLRVEKVPSRVCQRRGPRRSPWQLPIAKDTGSKKMERTGNYRSADAAMLLAHFIRRACHRWEPMA